MKSTHTHTHTHTHSRTHTSGVAEEASVEEGPVDVTDHRADVARGVLGLGLALGGLA
jgi:hypothetical protein